LNDVYLGQRGSFAIHGVAEASRIFFGKDVANVSLSEAATDCGRHSEPRITVAVREPEACGRTPQRRDSRDAGEEYVSEAEADRANPRTAAGAAARRR
jgi:membrane carboxypeptidase/penicillin-binding protein